jgi:hypothetical protein
MRPQLREEEALMDPIIKHVLDEDLVVPIMAIGCGSIIAVVAIVFTTMKTMVVGRSREHTKRELAAYVAEGSLDPDKAVAMINAGRPHWEAGNTKGKGGCCA